MYSANSLRSQLSFCRINHFLRSPVSIRPCTINSRVFCRTFAQAAESSAKPPKPKASTPLRRAAAASLPIRANPTPTRSTIQPVFTLATAEKYLLSRLPGHIPQTSQILHEALWVPKWNAGDTEGEIFVFANGTIVCWGLGEDAAEKFASEVISNAKAEIAPLAESETEDLEFVTDPTE